MDGSAERRVGNAAIFVGGEMVSRLIAFGATAYLAAVLGPGPFGVVGFALAVVSYLSVVVDAGFTDVGSREVARTAHHGDAAGLGVSVTIVRVGVAIACVAALMLLAPLLQPDPLGRRVLNLMSLLVIVAGVDVAWIYRGLGKGLRVGGSLMIRRILYAGLVLLVVRGPQDLLFVPVTQVVGELVGVVWLGAALMLSGWGKLDLRKGWDVFRSSGTLITTKLLRTSVVTLDVVLLGLLATNRDVGLYSAPYRLCFFFMAIAGAVQVAYLPDVSRADDGAPRREAARRHMEVSATLGTPMAVGGILVAGPLLQAIFGSEYLEGARAFQVLLVSLGILFLFSPVHNVLLAQKRLRVERRAMAVAAVLNGALNLLWIPRFGILGAAWATLIAEVVILILSAAPLGMPMLGALVRPLGAPMLASAIMAGAVVLFGAENSVWLVIPLGAVTYGVALAMLGGVPRDAGQVLRSAREGIRGR